MTHAFAADAAVLDTTEWIIVEAETCGLIGGAPPAKQATLKARPLIS
jgi:hypothetical protein